MEPAGESLKTLRASGLGLGWLQNSKEEGNMDILSSSLGVFVSLFQIKVEKQVPWGEGGLCPSGLH